MRKWEMIVFILFTIIIIQTNENLVVANVNSNDGSGFRLSKSVIPTNYDIKLSAHLDENSEKKFTFNGVVKIQIYCITETNEITFHSLELTIEDITIQQLKTRKYVEILKTSNDSRYDFIHVYLDKPLLKNISYILTVKFHGKIGDKMSGFYRSSYKDCNNNTQWIGTTFNEPDHARKAFPCFDEPAFKARFKISIEHRAHLTAISNMAPISREETRDGWVLTSFEETPLMSTYLIAYVISEFHHKDSNEHKDTKVSLWAEECSMYQVEYALSIAPKIIKFFEDYFDMKSTLKKMDIIAIPDFPANAMENWGLNTYIDASILLQPNVSSVSQKQHIWTTIAHELSHQWFGNLFTMKWWIDTWLKEGFATYLTLIAVKNLVPEWNHYFIRNNLNIMQQVFAVDALPTARAISAKAKNPEEIEQFFDSISYKKGSFLIRMIELQLPNEDLRRALQVFLKKYKFKNADRDEFWQVLNDYTHYSKLLSNNITVKHLMDSWTIQAGYPLITVKRNYKDGNVIITQINLPELLEDIPFNMRQRDWFLLDGAPPFLKVKCWTAF